MCEAKTGGGEGAPTTCYTISIDYVMLRIKGSDGDVGTMQLCRIISPVGLGALQDVSLGPQGSGGTERTGGYSLTYLLFI